MIAGVDDFIYNGISLSSLNYVIVDFNDGSSLGGISTDSQRSHEHVSMFNGKFQPFSSSTFNDVLKMEFSIMKKACPEDLGYIVTMEEIEGLKRWLNSPTPKKLKIVDYDFFDFYWMGSFNVEEVFAGGERVGANLTFESDRPFALKEARVYEGSIADTDNDSITILDTSDEPGYIYPTLQITVGEAGDLTLTNSFDGRETVIKNCEADETIMFTDTCQISTDSETHEVSDDFNFRFLRICNTYGNIKNVITSSLPITYSISYNPIAKVVYQ